MNKILGIAGLIAIVVFITLIVMHGNARYAEGKKTCEATQATAAVDGATEAAKELEKAKDETDRIPDDDLDRHGSLLGILRRPEDY